MPKPDPAQQQAIEVYEQLKKVRASKTLSLKPCPMLRSTIVGLDGAEQPMRLRYYQSQGIYHFLALKRLVLGDATGTGKTLIAIGALCYLWAKEVDNRVLIVCPKSAMRQWEGEFDKFTTGVKVFVVSGDIEQRTRIYEAWARHPVDRGKPVLVINYALLIRDWGYGAQVITPAKGKPVVLPGLLQRMLSEVTGLVTVFDEAQAFKNTATKTWQVCQYIAAKARRAYGLTATLLKNNLMEGFAIYKVIAPWVFTTKTAFMNDYCVTRLQSVPGGRKVPLVVGYRNLKHFREMIDPVYLGRLKHEISSELPQIITKDIRCELNPLEDAKYAEALEGVLELGDGDVREYSEHVALVALIYCQQVADSLTLLRYHEGDEVPIGLDFEQPRKVEMGSKEQALVELMTGELADTKTIIYTRFESLVKRLQELLDKEGIKSVRITGKESDTVRRAAQEAFQNLKSDVQVVIITDAGSEAINLQAASALLFYDMPWSWGNYVQTLGRPVRIGSVHDHVLVYHLIAERPRDRKADRKTIDHHVLEMLRSKKRVIDAVLGEAAVGALEFDKGSSSAKDLLQRMRSKEHETPGG
jgi:SWI/SNF-related matrix-associated actin-dependent regulator of chromatin subfamily A member 5